MKRHIHLLFTYLTVILLSILRRVDCQCRPAPDPPVFLDLFPNPLILTATTGKLELYDSGGCRTVFIGYCDYLGTTPKNSHKVMLITR